MPNMEVARTIQPFAPHQQTVFDPNYPPDEVAYPDRPFATYRGLGALGLTTVLRSPGDVALPVQAVYIGNANGTTVSVATGGGVNNGVVGGSLTRDRRTGRYKGWVSLNPACTANMVSVSLSNAVAGTTDLEIGGIGALADVLTLDDSPAWPLRFTRVQEREEWRRPRGGRQIVERGPAYVAMTIASTIWRRTSSTILTQLHQILDVGFAPLVWNENRGAAGSVYCFRRVADVDFEERFATFAASIQFEECI